MCPSISMFAALIVIDPSAGADRVTSPGTLMVPSPLSILKFPKPSELIKSGDRITSAVRSARRGNGIPELSSANGSAGANVPEPKMMFGGVGETKVDIMTSCWKASDSELDVGGVNVCLGPVIVLPRN